VKWHCDKSNISLERDVEKIENWNF
jgi:hypothetical protein